MTVDRAAIAALLPHAGAMCFIDEVESCDALHIVCRSMRHLSADNPLRRANRLSAVHAIEFAAQTAALHGALNVPTSSRPRPGLLVSVRDCSLYATALDAAPEPLRIEVRRTAAVQSLSSYEFTVSSAGATLAVGRLGVYTESA